jgi:hypothetical protein
MIVLHLFILVQWCRGHEAHARGLSSFPVRVERNGPEARHDTFLCNRKWPILGPYRFRLSSSRQPHPNGHVKYVLSQTNQRLDRAR